MREDTEPRALLITWQRDGNHMLVARAYGCVARVSRRLDGHFAYWVVMGPVHDRRYAYRRDNMDEEQAMSEAADLMVRWALSTPKQARGI